MSAGDITACSCAVDAEPDPHVLFVRLDVDVARALLNGREHQRVDELDDGRFAALLLERGRVDFLGVGDDLEVCRRRCPVPRAPVGEVGALATLIAVDGCSAPPYSRAIASRMAVSDATTGSTCRPVMNLMSSMANTLVGSAIASVSVVPVWPTGMTLYLVALSAEISRTTPGSRSKSVRLIAGTP